MPGPRPPIVVGMAVHRGTAWFEPPWWTVCVEPPVAAPDEPPVDGAPLDGAPLDGAPEQRAPAQRLPAQRRRVQGGSYAEAHALAVTLIATAAGVAESSVTLLLELVPGPREPG